MAWRLESLQQPFNQLAEPDIPEMKDAPTADLLDKSYSCANDPAQ